MGRHWRPEGEIARIIPVGERGRSWTRADDYASDRGHSRMAVLLGVVAAAVVAGASVGLFLSGRSQPAAAPNPAAIEWNAVQAVPTRTPDAEDVAWQNRSAVLHGSPEAQSIQVVRGSGAAAGGTAKPVLPIKVIDGDTFVMGRETVRIAGIDAPETHPPRCMDEARLGLAATEELRNLLNSGTVSLSASGAGHDQYGRLLRIVTVDGRDVRQAMIAAGMARPFGSGRKSWCP